MTPDPIEYLVSRVEMLESRLEKYIEENTRRLDTLIEITRHMSAINERQIRHSDDVAEIKARLAHIEVNINQSMQRVHQRIDDTAKVIEEKEERVIKDVRDDINKVRIESIETKDNLHAWLNRGWGAYLAICIAIFVIQYLSGQVIDNNKAVIDDLQKGNNQLKVRINDIETQISTIVMGNRK
jgi:tetrahydromethanopterin S-methyltransferase subunit G